VDVGLADGHDDHDAGWSPADGELLAQRRIRRQLGRAVDPKRLVQPGDHEQEGDAGVGDEVLERIQPVVPGEVGPRQPMIVEHLHEAARATFG
jgi:hypothetical protein